MVSKYSQKSPKWSSGSFHFPFFLKFLQWRDCFIQAWNLFRYGARRPFGKTVHRVATRHAANEGTTVRALKTGVNQFEPYPYIFQDTPKYYPKHVLSMSSCKHVPFVCIIYIYIYTRMYLYIPIHPHKSLEYPTVEFHPYSIDFLM